MLSLCSRYVTFQLAICPIKHCAKKSSRCQVPSFLDLPRVTRPFPMHDTESNPCWGWLGLACETNSQTLTQLLSYVAENRLNYFTASDRKLVTLDNKARCQVVLMQSASLQPLIWFQGYMV